MHKFFLRPINSKAHTATAAQKSNRPTSKAICQWTLLCSIFWINSVQVMGWAQQTEDHTASSTTENQATPTASMGEAKLLEARVSTANNTEGHPFSVQNIAILEARQIYEKKKWSELEALKTRVSGHPLSMYLEYWYLSQAITNRLPMDAALKARIDTFMKEQTGTYLKERLVGEWALSLLKKREFDAVKPLVEILPNWTTGGYACLRLTRDLQAKTVVTDLLAVFDPAEACYIVFDELVNRKKISLETATPLIRRYVEQNEIKPARRLVQSFLSAADLKSFNSIMDAPKKWLEAQKELHTTPAARMLQILAMGRLAREKDVRSAVDYFEKKWLGAIKNEEKSWVYAQFARVAALKLDAQSFDWYKKAGEKVALSDDSHEWRVRMALRQSKVDWALVQQYILAMPTELREKDVWVYWLAKAYEGQNKKEEFKQTMESIHQQYTYYGQLATEALGKKVEIPKSAPLPTEEEMKAAMSNPSLIRAIWLFESGWRIEGVREWNFAIRDMSDRQLLAAAHLAHNHQILDRAVNTADRTVDEHNFHLRFVSPFKEQMTEKVKNTKLELSWVYGLIRQESRFIMDARSGVGASGLMQLMPGTAKWVAKKIGMKDFTQAKVNEMDVNLTLGTQYLNMVSEKLDYSPVLASAAYNAGPSRSIRWRSTLPREVEAEIFVESIPFDETRDYVQKVLSNATYYEVLFTGKPQSLKARLGSIQPKPITSAELP